MNVQTYKYLLLTAVMLAVVSCGPKKQEEAKPEESPMMELQKPEEKPMMELQKPEKGAKEEAPLTPEQEDQLRIDDDNVLNPLPG